MHDTERVERALAVYGKRSDTRGRAGMAAAPLPPHQTADTSAGEPQSVKRAAVGAIRFRVARSISYEEVLALPQARMLRAALATYRATIGYDPQPRALVLYSDRRAIWLAQGKRCYVCRRYVPSFSTGETDHRQPLYRGGTNDLENLAFACLECNRRKGIRTEAEYRQMLSGQDDLISQLEPERQRLSRELDALRDAVIEAEVARRILYELHDLSAIYQQTERPFDPKAGEDARC